MIEKPLELEPDETILLRTRKHPGLMYGGLVMLVYALIMVFLSGLTPDLLFAGLGLVLVISGFFQWSYSEFVLTDSRLLKVSGYYYIRAEEVLLKKVGHVTLWQNILDRWWDRGVITLYGIGIRTQKIRGISNASSFKNAIHSQLSVEPEHYFD